MSSLPEKFRRISSTPAYRLVAEAIERQILSGRILPGDPIGTEAELVKQFGVNRSTVREGIRLLAECEGIFAETAGGVTVGVAKKLIASGKIPANDSAVLCVTGNGLKTLDALNGTLGHPREIKPSLREFEALVANEVKAN